MQLLCLPILLAAAIDAGAAEPSGQFFRGINLNGPPLVIDGQQWEGKDAAGLVCQDATFENQAVELFPSTDPSRARMIRSSVWSPQGQNRLRIEDMPPGEYAVFVYAWEDNDPQIYTVSLNGKVVLSDHNSGQAGHWHKLGPWQTSITGGALELTTRGGHANFSGIELWRIDLPPPEPVDPAAVEHFDQHIAPLLAQHCLECHNGFDKKGGLDLSRRKTALEGGDTGPALEPGQAADSFLWQRLEAGEMPPDKPLDPDKLALVNAWIESGAIWGTDPVDPYLATSDKRAGYNWWSLQPPKRPEPPSVANRSWPAGEIDAFVLARLEAAGLQPSPEADRRILIRRLSFDLIGLPPTPEELEAFVNDDSPDAYGKLVDRLLDSPHYGERWARRWLDTVRFAESQGFERNKLWPDAWKYRDWVIWAFNHDLPCDEFVRLQLAGDVLRPDDPLAVIATGQLVVGPYDLTIQGEGTEAMRAVAREEELEGILATAAQTYLGLTVNCARCHDHKFDPIRQTEYYQLAAALGGVRFGERESLSPAGQEQARQRRDELLARTAPLEELIKAIVETQDEAAEPPAPIARVSDGLAALYDFDEGGGTTVRDTSGAAEPLNLQIRTESAVRWEQGALVVAAPVLISSDAPPARLNQAVKASGAVTIEAWIQPVNASQDGPARIVTLSADPGQRNFTLGQAASRYDVRLRSSKTDGNGMPSLAADAGAEARLVHVVYTRDSAGTARLYLDGSERASQPVSGDFSNWDDKFQLALANELTSDRPWQGTLHLVAIYSRALAADEVRQNYQAGASHVRPVPAYADVVARLSPDQRREYDRLLSELSEIQALERLLSGGPAHAVTPRQPELFHVLARGDYRERGEIAGPKGLAALVGLPADFELAPDSNEADRRARLAQWITDPRNPLTARVIANRFWQYHFGVGLVETPNDFGFNGGRPSHPELLDWLATELVRDGWSLKRLHRRILTSATYRQSSLPRPEALAVDANNRLLWRKGPLRLEAEELRDAVLAISGQLNPTMGGPGYRDFNTKSGLNEVYEPFDAFGPAYSRRTVYRTWVRSGTNRLLDVLDCPDPTVTTPRRTVTTTPLQALSLVNNAFMVHAAGQLGERLQREAPGELPAQIQRAYRLAYLREPSADELARADRFVSQFGLPEFCLVLFNSNEFLYLD